MWGKIKAFLKEHGTLVAGGVVGVLVAAYLVLRSQASSGPQSAQISFPPSGGGGSAGNGTDTGTSTQVNPVALTLSGVTSAINNFAHAAPGQPFNFSEWVAAVTSQLPSGVTIPQGVWADIWNGIYSSPTLSLGGQAAIDYTNSVLNDYLLHPGNYPATGNPIAIPPPAPAPTPGPSPTPSPVPTPTPISVSSSSKLMNGLVATSWTGAAPSPFNQ